MLPSSQFCRHLITAALPYANGPLHIGHLAGCYLPADIYTRYLRAQGKEVLFLCGSDEYGIPIAIRARKEKTKPQEIVDRYHKQISASLNAMNISLDIYSRTTAPIHTETTQDFFSTLHSKHAFIEQQNEHFFDPQANVFLADRYISGQCPYCQNPDAYGDQCEKCGSSLSAEELIHPQSRLSDATPIKKTTTHWYLPLDKHSEWLREWLFGSTTQHWKHNVLEQCKSWIEQGLRPRAMTRDADWGVPLPLPNTTGKVTYVWFDAPIGYISISKQATEQWRDYWYKPDSQIAQFIGKDNVVFHCIIFPAILKAYDDTINRPQTVCANEFLNIEGQKISTSRNWAVWVDEYLDDFPNCQDELRYALISILPETKDADFTWTDFQARVNNELVSIVGNFINRSLVLTHKYCGGVVPPFHAEYQNDADADIRRCVGTTHKRVEDSIEAFRFREGLFQVVALARNANKYLQIKQPWTRAKDLPAPDAQIDIDNTLYLCIQTVANLAIVLQPFLPNATQKIAQQLRIDPQRLSWANCGKTDIVPTQTKISEPSLLFEKISDEAIAQQINKLHGIS